MKSSKKYKQIKYNHYFFFFQMSQLIVVLLLLSLSTVKGQLIGNCLVDKDASAIPLLRNYSQPLTVADYDCPNHFYCPYSNPNVPESIPQMCPPTPKCQAARLVTYRCNVSQGLYEPVVCPPGYFCSNPKTLEIWQDLLIFRLQY